MLLSSPKVLLKTRCQRRKELQDLPVAIHSLNRVVCSFSFLTFGFSENFIVNQSEPIEQVPPTDAAISAVPVLEIDNLHTQFFTSAGVVRAVDGVSYTVNNAGQGVPTAALP